VNKRYAKLDFDAKNQECDKDFSEARTDKFIDTSERCVI
jgi:hypothetical protein